MIRKILFMAFLISSLSSIAQGPIKTMFHNLFEFPEFSPLDQASFLRDILDAHEPDVCMASEFETNKATVLNGTKFDSIQTLTVPNKTNAHDGLDNNITAESGAISINIYNAIGQLMTKIDSKNFKAIVHNVSQFSDDIYSLTSINFNSEPLKFLKTS